MYVMMYVRYYGKASEALIQLNKARTDGQWGYKALCQMIQICLNPDNNTIGGEVFEDSSGDAAAGAAAAGGDTSEHMALRTAERLMKVCLEISFFWCLKKNVFNSNCE